MVFTWKAKKGKTSTKRSRELLLLRMGNYPWRRINHNLANGTKMKKGNGYTITLWFFPERTEHFTSRKKRTSENHNNGTLQQQPANKQHTNHSISANRITSPSPSKADIYWPTDAQKGNNLQGTPDPVFRWSHVYEPSVNTWSHFPIGYFMLVVSSAGSFIFSEWISFIWMLMMGSIQQLICSVLSGLKMREKLIGIILMLYGLTLEVKNFLYATFLSILRFE